MKKMLLILSIATFTSCCDKGVIDEKYLYTKEYIESFVKEQFSPNVKTKDQSNVSSIYIDFSSSIQGAFDDNEIKNYLGYIVSEYIYKTSFFILRSSDIVKQQIDNDTQKNDFLKKCQDKNEFKEKMAPLSKTLETIVENNENAIFITDFDELDDKGEIMQVPYAAESIKKWISLGNSISFFYRPFNQNNNKRKIFFAVFLKGNSKPNDRLKNIIDKFKNNSSFSSFQLGMHDVINYNYGSSEKTGLVNESLLQSYQVNGNDKNYTYLDFKKESNIPCEFYQYNDLVWDDNFHDDVILPYVVQCTDPKCEKNILFSNIYLDYKNFNGLDYKGLGLNVTELSSIYENFTIPLFLKRNHLPVLIKDGNKMVWDESSEEDKKIQNYYKENSLELKPLSMAKTENAKEFFDVTTVEKGGKKLIKVKLHKYYNAQRVPDETGLYKLEIKLKSGMNIEKLSFFDLTAFNGTSNVSLKRSMEQVLRELYIINEFTLHTIYLKFGN
jgi:hypothetical protein